MPPEMVTYEWFAESFHFTEDMTDSLSVEALEWWPLIRAARIKASETRQAQDARMQTLTQQSRGNGFTEGMRTLGSG